MIQFLEFVKVFVKNAEQSNQRWILNQKNYFIFSLLLIRQKKKKEQEQKTLLSFVNSVNFISQQKTLQIFEHLNHFSPKKTLLEKIIKSSQKKQGIVLNKLRAALRKKKLTLGFRFIEIIRGRLEQKIDLIFTKVPQIKINMIGKFEEKCRKRVKQNFNRLRQKTHFLKDREDFTRSFARRLDLLDQQLAQQKALNKIVSIKENEEKMKLFEANLSLQKELKQVRQLRKVFNALKLNRIIQRDRKKFVFCDNLFKRQKVKASQTLGHLDTNRRVVKNKIRNLFQKLLQRNDQKVYSSFISLLKNKNNKKLIQDQMYSQSKKMIAFMALKNAKKQSLLRILERLRSWNTKIKSSQRGCFKRLVQAQTSKQFRVLSKLSIESKQSFNKHFGFQKLLSVLEKMFARKKDLQEVIKRLKNIKDREQLKEHLLNKISYRFNRRNMDYVMKRLLIFNHYQDKIKLTTDYNLSISRKLFNQLFKAQLAKQTALFKLYNDFKKRRQIALSNIFKRLIRNKYQVLRIYFQNLKQNKDFYYLTTQQQRKKLSLLKLVQLLSKMEKKPKEQFIKCLQQAVRRKKRSKKLLIKILKKMRDRLQQSGFYGLVKNYKDQKLSQYDKIIKQSRNSILHFETQIVPNYKQKILNNFKKKMPFRIAQILKPFFEKLVGHNRNFLRAKQAILTMIANQKKGKISACLQILITHAQRNKLDQYDNLFILFLLNGLLQKINRQRLRLGFSRIQDIETNRKKIKNIFNKMASNVDRSIIEPVYESLLVHAEIKEAIKTLQSKETERFKALISLNAIFKRKRLEKQRQFMNQLKLGQRRAQVLSKFINRMLNRKLWLALRILKRNNKSVSLHRSQSQMYLRFQKLVSADLMHQQKQKLRRVFTSMKSLHQQKVEVESSFLSMYNQLRLKFLNNILKLVYKTYFKKFHKKYRNFALKYMYFNINKYCLRSFDKLRENKQNFHYIKRYFLQRVQLACFGKLKEATARLKERSKVVFSHPEHRKRALGGLLKTWKQRNEGCQRQVLWQLRELVKPTSRKFELSSFHKRQIFKKKKRLFDGFKRNLAIKKEQKNFIKYLDRLVKGRLAIYFGILNASVFQKTALIQSRRVALNLLMKNLGLCLQASLQKLRAYSRQTQEQQQAQLRKCLVSNSERKRFNKGVIMKRLTGLLAKNRRVQFPKSMLFNSLLSAHANKLRTCLLKLSDPERQKRGPRSALQSLSNIFEDKNLKNERVFLNKLCVLDLQTNLKYLSRPLNYLKRLVRRKKRANFDILQYQNPNRPIDPFKIQAVAALMKIKGRQDPYLQDRLMQYCFLKLMALGQTPLPIGKMAMGTMLEKEFRAGKEDSNDRLSKTRRKLQDQNHWISIGRQSLIERKSRLQNETNAFQGDNKDILEKLKALSGSNSEKEQQLKDLQQQIDGIQDNIKKMHRDKKGQKEVEEALKIKKIGLELQIKALDAQITEQEKNNSMNDTKLPSEQYNSFQGGEGLRESVGQLKDKIKLLKNEKKNIRKSQLMINQTLEQLNKKIADAQNQKNNLFQNKTLIEEKNFFLNQKKDELQEKLIVLLKDRENLLKLIEELEARIEALNAEIAGLELKIAKMEKGLQDKTDLYNEALEQKIKMNLKQDFLQKQNRQLEDRIVEVQKKMLQQEEHYQFSKMDQDQQIAHNVDHTDLMRKLKQEIFELEGQIGKEKQKRAKVLDDNNFLQSHRSLQVQDQKSLVTEYNKERSSVTSNRSRKRMSMTNDRFGQVLAKIQIIEKNINDNNYNIDHLNNKIKNKIQMIQDKKNQILQLELQMEKQGTVLGGKRMTLETHKSVLLSLDKELELLESEQQQVKLQLIENDKKKGKNTLICDQLLKEKNQLFDELSKLKDTLVAKQAELKMYEAQLKILKEKLGANAMEQLADKKKLNDLKTQISENERVIISLGDQMSILKSEIEELEGQKKVFQDQQVNFQIKTQKRNTNITNLESFISQRKSLLNNSQISSTSDDRKSLGKLKKMRTSCQKNLFIINEQLDSTGKKLKEVKDDINLKKQEIEDKRSKSMLIKSLQVGDQLQIEQKMEQKKLNDMSIFENNEEILKNNKDLDDKKRRMTTNLHKIQRYSQQIDLLKPTLTPRLDKRTQTETKVIRLEDLSFDPQTLKLNLPLNDPESIENVILLLEKQLEPLQDQNQQRLQPDQDEGIEDSKEQDEFGFGLREPRETLPEAVPLLTFWKQKEVPSLNTVYIKLYKQKIRQRNPQEAFETPNDISQMKQQQQQLSEQKIWDGGAEPRENIILPEKIDQDRHKFLLGDNIGFEEGDHSELMNKKIDQDKVKPIFSPQNIYQYQYEEEGRRLGKRRLSLKDLYELNFEGSKLLRDELRRRTESEYRQKFQNKFVQCSIWDEDDFETKIIYKYKQSQKEIGNFKDQIIQTNPDFFDKLIPEKQKKKLVLPDEEDQSGRNKQISMVDSSTQPDKEIEEQILEKIKEELKRSLPKLQPESLLSNVQNSDLQVQRTEIGTQKQDFSQQEQPKQTKTIQVEQGIQKKSDKNIEAKDKDLSLSQDQLTQLIRPNVKVLESGTQISNFDFDELKTLPRILESGIQTDNTFFSNFPQTNKPPKRVFNLKNYSIIEHIPNITNEIKLQQSRPLSQGQSYQDQYLESNLEDTFTSQKLKKPKDLRIYTLESSLNIMSHPSTPINIYQQDRDKQSNQLLDLTSLFGKYIDLKISQKQADVKKDFLSKLKLGRSRQLAQIFSLTKEKEIIVPETRRYALLIALQNVFFKRINDHYHHFKLILHILMTKGYLNSLFKWKLINIESNMIKRADKQEVKDFSLGYLIHQKLLQNQASAFRSINLRSHFKLSNQYFTKLLPVIVKANSRYQTNMKSVLQYWFQIKDDNKWFRKIFTSLARNTPIQAQIALWRMKFHVSKKKPIKQIPITSVQKFDNVINRIKDKNLNRALWQIQSFIDREDDEISKKESIVFSEQDNQGMDTLINSQRRIDRINDLILKSKLRRFQWKYFFSLLIRKTQQKLSKCFQQLYIAPKEESLDQTRDSINLGFKFMIDENTRCKSEIESKISQISVLEIELKQKSEDLMFMKNHFVYTFIKNIENLIKRKNRDYQDEFIGEIAFKE